MVTGVEASLPEVSAAAVEPVDLLRKDEMGASDGQGERFIACRGMGQGYWSHRGKLTNRRLPCILLSILPSHKFAPVLPTYFRAQLAHTWA